MIKRIVIAVALLVALKYGAEWVVNYVPAGIKGASPDFLTDIEPTSVFPVTTLTNKTLDVGNLPNCADPGVHLSYAESHTFDCGISKRGD